MDRIERYIQLIEERGKIFLAATLLLVLASIAGILLVEINTDFTAFMPAKSAYLQQVQEMNDAFGDSDQILLLLETDGSKRDLEQLHEDLQQLESLDGVQAVETIIPEQLFSLDDEQWESSVAMLQEINDRVLLSSREEGGYWFTVYVHLVSQSRFPKVVSGLESFAEGESRDFLLSGEPYLQGKIFSYILQVLLFLPPGAIILLLLVFRFRIGSMRATALSMVPAVIGGVITLGSLSWSLGTISIMTAIIPIFIIVLGSADGLHVTSHVIDRLEEGYDNREAIAATLRMVGIPIILTSVTTMIGFLSMLLIDSSAIRQMGIGAAWGILLAGLATWVVLPILLLQQKPLKHTKGKTGSLTLKFFEKLQGAPAIFLTIIIIAVAIPGAGFLRSDFSMLTMYKEKTEVRQSIEKTSSVLGGAIPVTLLFPVDSVLDQDVSGAVLEFHDAAAENGVAANSISLFSVVRGILQSTLGMEGIPDSPLMQEGIINQVHMMNPSLVRNFYSEEKGLGRAYFFLPDLKDETLEAFICLAEDIGERYGITLSPVGSVFAMKAMNDKIVAQQVQSLVLAVILVVILSAITQKSIKLGLLSGVPIIVTLIALFGFMGYTGIELSVVSGIMMALTVGVGIDYAIHYVSLYRYGLNKTSVGKSGSVKPAKTNSGNPGTVAFPGMVSATPASNALRYVATPILANAMGLAIGFSVMNLSPFRIHVTLSLLMWVTMLLSAFLSLSLLPTLLGIRKEGKLSNQ